MKQDVDGRDKPGNDELGDVIPGWSEGPDLRCAIAHRGISRFRVRVFDGPRNDSGPALFHERARWLHVQRERVDLVAGARIYFGDDRIVPGDDTVGMARNTGHDIPALEHVAKI